MNWFAFPLFIALLAALTYALVTRRIPARWPVPTVERDTQPGSYWFFVGLYGFALIVTAPMALRGLW